MAWRSRIDDYLAKFETLMSNAKIRGYSRQQTPFSQWTYGDALLFCLQLVTGQGKLNFFSFAKYGLRLAYHEKQSFIE